MPPSSLRLRVPPRAATLTKYMVSVRSFLQGHNIDDRAARDIFFCVHESCVNAIKHSGSDDDIDVELSLGEGVVRLFIADQGRGLDLNRYDAHRQPSLEKPGGRGLYLMACLMDDIEISLDGGTEVRMIKRLPPPVDIP